MLPLTQRAVASAPVKTAGSKYGVGSLRAAVRDTTLGKLRALAAEGPRELTAFRDPPGRLFASIGVFAGAVVDRLPVRAADLFRRIWYGLIAYLSFFPATLARCRLATVGIAATPQDSLLLSPWTSYYFLASVAWTCFTVCDVLVSMDVYCAAPWLIFTMVSMIASIDAGPQMSWYKRQFMQELHPWLPYHFAAVVHTIAATLYLLFHDNHGGWAQVHESADPRNRAVILANPAVFGPYKAFHKELFKITRYECPISRLRGIRDHYQFRIRTILAMGYQDVDFLGRLLDDEKIMHFLAISHPRCRYDDLYFYLLQGRAYFRGYPMGKRQQQQLDELLEAASIEYQIGKVDNESLARAEELLAQDPFLDLPPPSIWDPFWDYYDEFLWRTRHIRRRPAEFGRFLVLTPLHLCRVVVERWYNNLRYYVAKKVAVAAAKGACLKTGETAVKVVRWFDELLDDMLKRAGIPTTQQQRRQAALCLLVACMAYAIARRGRSDPAVNVLLRVAHVNNYTKVAQYMVEDDFEYQASGASVGLAGLCFAAITGYDTRGMMPHHVLKGFNEIPRTAMAFETVVPVVIDAFEKLVNWIQQAFGFSPTFCAKRAFDVLDPIAKIVKRLQADHHWDKLPWTQVDYDQLLTLNRELHEEIKRCYRPEFATTRQYANKLLLDVERMMAEAEASNCINAGMRIEPLHVAMCSKPGRGKSNFVWPLLACLYAANVPAQDREQALLNLSSQIFVKTSEDGFNDGYRTGAFACVIDDAGQMRDSASNPNPDWGFLIHAINDFPYPLNMAALEKKGNTFFTSRLILTTTNACLGNVESIIDKGALYRRHHWHMHVEVLPQYRNDLGGVDVSKTSGPLDLSIWEFKRYRYDGAGFVFTGESYDFFGLARALQADLAQRADRNIEKSGLIKQTALDFAADNPATIGTARRVVPDPEDAVRVSNIVQSQAPPVPPRPPLLRTPWGQPRPPMRPDQRYGQPRPPMRPDQRYWHNRIHGRQLTADQWREIALEPDLQYQCATAAVNFYLKWKFSRYFDFHTYERWLSGITAFAILLAALVGIYGAFRLVSSIFGKETVTPIEEQMGAGTLDVYHKLRKNMLPVLVDGQQLAVCLALGGDKVLVPTHFFQKDFTVTVNGKQCAVVVERDYGELSLGIMQGRQINLPKIMHLLHTATSVPYPDALFMYGMPKLNCIDKVRAKHIRNFSYKSETGPKKLSDVYQYNLPTTLGDCGSLLLGTTGEMANRVIGIHFAGSPMAGTGYAALIPPLLEYQMRELGSPPYGPLNASPVSRLLKTPLYGELGESKFTRPYLGMCTIDGEKKHVHDIATAKYAKPKVEPGPEITAKLMRCAKAFTANHLQVLGEEYRRTHVVGFEDAVTGKSFTHVSSLPRGTSAGYPHCLSHKNGKKDFFGAGQDYEFTSEACNKLRANVDRLVRLARETGRFDDSIYYADSMKDEPRETVKALQGKTRLVSVAPIDITIIGRMAYGNFIDSFLKAKLMNGSAVGTNVYTEWDDIAKLLLRAGGDQRIIAGDYSGFDATHSQTMIAAVFHAMDLWYAGSSHEDQLLRDAIQHDLANSKHVWGNTAVQWEGCLPSGHPLTTVLNTIAVLIASTFAFAQWHEQQGGSFDEGICAFYNKMAHFQYGDDDICSVPPEFEYDITHKTQNLALIGYTYTDDTKQEGASGYKSLSEVKFLQRYFRYDQDLGKFQAALELTSAVQKPLYWVMKGPHSHIIPYLNIERVLMELALHGRDTYKQYVSQLLGYAADAGVVPRHTTYEESLAASMQASDRWWLQVQGCILPLM